MSSCPMCGRELPPDRRWRIMQFLNPRPPMCLTDLEECYRRFASRLGITVSDQQVADVLKRRSMRHD